MEFEALVSHHLYPGHKLLVAVGAGLVVEFVKTSRIVALIEGHEVLSPAALLAHNTHKRSGVSREAEVKRALLVFLPGRRGVSCALEKVLPVDARFSCTLDPSVDSDGRVLLLSISSSVHKLLLEMNFSERTNTFVSEVLRAAEGVSKRKAPTPEFTWLKPYLAGGGSSSSSDTAVTTADKIFTIGGPCREEDLLGSCEVTSNSGSSNNSPRLDSKHIGASTNISSTLPTKATSVTVDDIKINNLKIDNSDVVSNVSTDSMSERSKFYDNLSPYPIAARESHVRHQMEQREASYTHNISLNVFIGTWNVNGVPPSIGLADWLAVDKDPPDFYALGFQELDLATETYIFNATPKEEEWRNAVLGGVHPAARYKEVACIRLVGMLLLVLVQEKHVNEVRNIRTHVVPTGLMNMLGNKGGVSVRMDLYNTSICFVNCHLAAHVEEYERRNEDYDCICEKTVFGANNHGSPPKYIKDHDHIYFFGDLNYRIQSPDLDIRYLASVNDFKKLLSLDQLNLQREVGRVFKGYNEGNITFRPTFKYDLNTDSWDSSEKKRQPAWCDRILWAGEGIKQTLYRSHMSLKISDHKPVSAFYNAQIKVIDIASYHRIHEEMMKQLDKLENEYLPQVSLSVTEVILKPVQFLQPQQASLVISNTGQIPVQFSFIKKLNDDSCSKPWLKMHPMSGFIIPGANCEIILEVKVDKESAGNLNSGSDKMYDILVLHLEGGKDFFITVTGDYQRSCFGSSINALVHMKKPFIEVPVAQLIDLESTLPKTSLELPHAIPKELWYLVDHLHTHGQAAEGLFARPGLTKEVLNIRSCLDAGAPSRDLPGSVHSVAEALLLFLDALPEPVVTYSVYSDALHAAHQGLAPSKTVLDALPDYHRNVFNYIIAFLKELLVHRDQNKLDANTLAMVFGLIFIRRPPHNSKYYSASHLKIEDSDIKKQIFVRHFINAEY